MSDRVLSTATAREAIVAFQGIVNGPLLDQINQLNSKGQLLSQPDNWDGRLATEFRAHWSDTHQKLIAIQHALEELRMQIHQINQNIMQAGGNM
ncbi:MAG: pyrophosphorylase [Chloroflexia bacterium]|nr:pyrophosphorylase [Chloroflexia bacterium]